MSPSDLADLHISRLHERAAKLGVPGFRRLRRDELVAEIEARSEGAPAKEADEEPAVAAPEEELRAGGEAIEPDDGAEEEPEAAEEPGEPVAGVLELTRSGHGFLRLHGLERGDDDVYVSASQVRRCELRPGDSISGPARAPRRGERHRALVHVDEVNGAAPLTAERSRFDELTPVVPKRRVQLGADPGDLLARAVDLLNPLALGQRVLVRAAPRSGRTTLLRTLARAIDAADGTELIVLLVDERPEEATVWREMLPDAELAIATADLAPEEQVRVAELALERARRRAEAGVDVVLVVDSLSRLAFAAGGVVEVRRLFGSGRELAEEGAGSLTVIATVLAGVDGEDEAERAVITTENSLIVLDPELARDGVFPAIRVQEGRVALEEDLREPEELERVRRLRSQLADLDPREAAAKLAEQIKASPSNQDLLAGLD